MPRRKSDKQIYEAQMKAKDDVRGSLGKSAAYLKRLKKVSVTAVINPFAEKVIQRLLTGTALDRILSKTGGVELGSTIELFGVFASGKTQICAALAAEALKIGRVIYIDGEHTFRSERFVEVCKHRGIDIESLGERFLLYQPSDWVEQESVTMNLPEFAEDGSYLDVKLIIVDSLMKHWASTPDFYGREKLTQRQQLVRAQMERLGDYVRRHGGVFLFTNQVYDKPVDTTYAAPEDKIGSRGGRTVEHYADYRLFLRKGRGNMRFARLVDSPDLPLMEVPFILDASGIGDIRDPAERAKAVVMSTKYGDKFSSGQVHAVNAGKEYKIKAYELGYITEEEALDMGVTEDDIAKVKNQIEKSMLERLGDDLTIDEKAILDSMEISDYEDVDPTTSPIIDFDKKPTSKDGFNPADIIVKSEDDKPEEVPDDNSEEEFN